MAIILKQAYTFDDVLLVPNKSDVLPREVSLCTNLTKELKLHTHDLHTPADSI